MSNRLIKDGESLVGAWSKYGSIIQVYDDGFGPLWAWRNYFGIGGIVRARTWGDAYEILEDAFIPEATETTEEMIAEYGKDFTENIIWNECFGFRPNGANDTDEIGHGIYAKDLSGDYLDELTPELMKDLGITLDIEYEEEHV